MAGRLVAVRSIRRLLSPVARSGAPVFSVQDSSSTSNVISDSTHSNAILSDSVMDRRLSFAARIPPFAARIPLTRSFSSDISALPPITDPDVKQALKNLLASSWDEIRDSIKSDVTYALSKETDDKVGQEALANTWRAAEAVEHFGGVLVTLRMELDDLSGANGENVRPLSDEFQGALRAAHRRYNTYLDAFGPDETYLRKKVEVELGTKMIHIKMRCSGLDSEWGKITVLGTSGLAGSYIEHRAA